MMLPVPLYSAEIRSRAVQEFGLEGAWLLFSIDHYGWRARYDLASALVRGAPVEDTDQGRHRQSVVDLEVQGAIIVVAEQLARLVLASREHQPGTEAFLDKYLAKEDAVALIREAAGIARSDLDMIVPVPDDPLNIFRSLKRLRQEGADEALAIAVHEQLREALDLVHRNLLEMREELVEREVIEDSDTPGQQGHALRRVDNAFRHGQRLLFPDTLPAKATVGVVARSPMPSLSPWAVNLLQSTEQPRYATVDSDPQRTAAHLVNLRHLAIDLKQIERGFLLTRLFDEPGLLLTILSIDPDEPDPLEG